MLLQDQILTLALQEDIGHGDVTTDSIIPLDKQAEAVIIAKEGMVVSGLWVAARVFQLLDPGIRFQFEALDSQFIQSGSILGRITGSARAMLIGERIALNFLQRLSGIATQTARYVQLTLGTPAQIIDTRKTTPGHRILEKYAVRCGGGRNHRFGLSDGILIKDNHLKIAGSITKAVQSVRQFAPHLMKIEVEIDSIEQIEECLKAEVDCILLDNMNPDQLKRAVELIREQCLTEASGGINMENIRDVAETGVDFISVGALTHTVRAVDLSMDILG